MCGSDQMSVRLTTRLGMQVCTNRKRTPSQVIGTGKVEYLQRQSVRSRKLPLELFASFVIATDVTGKLDLHNGKRSWVTLQLKCSFHTLDVIFVNKTIWVEFPVVKKLVISYCK